MEKDLQDTQVSEAPLPREPRKDWNYFEGACKLAIWCLVSGFVMGAFFGATAHEAGLFHSFLELLKK